MILQVENLHQYGLIKDIPSWDAALPLNAITEAWNVVFRDGAARKQEGYTLLKTLGVTSTVVGGQAVEINVPGVVCPYLGANGKLWWVLQGALTEADVTRAAGGDYNNYYFRGGPFHEGVILTSLGSDVPQWKEDWATTTKFIDLPNWPASTYCKHIIGFKDFLVAVNITKPGGQYPTMFKWSHGASPGTYPDSWDETDPALDAGEQILGEEPSELVCCVPQGDLCIVYGKNTTWLVQPSGDSFIFSFRKIFDFGINDWDSVTVLPDGRHILVSSSGDFLALSGSRVETLGIGRVRNFYLGQLPSGGSVHPRVLHRETKKEVWFLYPTASTVEALVWHWPSDTWSYMPSVNPLIFVSCRDPLGMRSKGATELWAVHPTSYKLYKMGDVWQREGQSYVSLLKRANICHLPSEQGPVHAPNTVKLLTAIWPRLESADTGATYAFYVTAKMNPNDTGTTKSGTFTPTTGSKLDIYLPGRYFDVMFCDGNASQEWKLDGFGLDLSPIGAM